MRNGPVTLSRGHLRRPRHLIPARTLVLTLAVAFGGVGLSSCSSAPSRSSTPTTHVVGLCAEPSEITQLTVVRVERLGPNGLHFAFPSKVTVSGTARLSPLISALCALPDFPGGIHACPVDLGVRYELRFVARAGEIAPVEVDPGGCQPVNGLGKTRWAATVPKLWELLGSVVGISAATSATFGGASSP